MFKLAPIEFTENPYICIRIGEGCPASCDSCKISIKNFPNPQSYDFKKIKKLVDEADSKFDSGFDIVFGNLNGASHPHIIKILEYGIQKGRKVRFQLNYNITAAEIRLLQDIEKQLGTENIYIKIAKNCKDDPYWSRDLFLLIKVLRKFSRFKFYIDVFLKISQHEKLIETFMKHSTSKQRDHSHNLVIGDSIDIKFHDYSWTINDKNKTIDNLKGRDSCQQLHQVYCREGDVYVQDSVDILLNGDMFIHDNLCNIGDLMISNIFFDNKKIYHHFDEYLSYLKNLGESSPCQADACYSCIRKGYSYLQ